MAVMVSFTCDKCFQEKREPRAATDYGSTCNDCRKKLRDEALQAFLELRAGLSVEQRLRMIEEWIWEHEHRPRGPVVFG